MTVDPPQASPPVIPPAAKPLLLEALGIPFLSYVLAATPEEIESWLSSDVEEFEELSRNQALGQLNIVLHVRGGDEPFVRRLNLANIFGIYQEPLATTLVNVVRGMASGGLPAWPEVSSVQEILVKLSWDVYPIYLLPEDGSVLSHGTGASVFQHPLRRKFEAALLDDRVFEKFFVDENEASGKSGYLAVNTGHAGAVQLLMFAEMLLNSGWRAATLASSVTPNPEAYAKAVVEQFSIVRNALIGQPERVIARVGFTGFLLNSDEPLDLGWGQLRKVDERDRRLIPRGITGKLSGTGADGKEVLVDYGGDVVLETTIEYRVSRQQIDLGSEWPKSLDGMGVLQRIIESVQLGALLSQEFRNNEPIAVVPTWRHVHDPLAHGFGGGWIDPKMMRPFMPRQLTPEEERALATFASVVQQNRIPNIDVAIRRTLRASTERRDYADMLLDAVIAWENLLGSRDATTLRVTGSLAWLLKAKPVERLELQKELNDIYRMRSDIVHGNKSVEGPEVVAKAQRALETAIDALRTMFTGRLDLLTACERSDIRSKLLLMGG